MRITENPRIGSGSGLTGYKIILHSITGPMFVVYAEDGYPWMKLPLTMSSLERAKPYLSKRIYSQLMDIVTTEKGQED